MATTMRYVVGGLLLVMAAGCVKPPLQGRADPYVPDQINIANRDLRDRTAFQPAVLKRENGILYVTQPVRAATNLDLHVDYKVVFVDSTGSVVDETGWLGGLTLTRNTWSYIRVNSANANAADFHLQLRYAQ